MSEASDWVATIAADTIDADYPSMATVGEVEVALCRVGGEVFAIGNICTHAYARLSDGFVEGCEVFCPLHQGSFDVRTGEAVSSPCYEPVASYATKVEDGIVYVSVKPRD
jgi:nitrite reductase/ring-hydroxylating ferredoxin subunit